jgi:hypothetical protein
LNSWSLGQGQSCMVLPVKLASFDGGFRCRVSGVRKKTQKLQPEHRNPEIREDDSVPPE